MGEVRGIPFCTIFWASRSALGEHLAGEQVGYRWALWWTYIEKGLDAFGVLCRLLDISAAYPETVGLYEFTMMANVCLYEEFEFKAAEMFAFWIFSWSFQTLAAKRPFVVSRYFSFTFLHLHHSYTLSMSRASKLTLAGTSLGAIGIVVLVHYQQQSEKAVSIQAQIRV